MTGETQNRLRWRCRRGMLELDALLLAFLESDYPLLGAKDRQAFSRLLDREDLELYNWLAGREAPPEDLRSLVDRIRTCIVRST